MMINLNDNDEHIALTVENNNKDDTPALTVESVDNHVYYYAQVNSDRTLALIKLIRKLDTQLRTERLDRDLPEEFPYTPIWLHINSGGGDLFSAFSIAEQLRKIKSPIHSVVEGYAASAATIISMACTKRLIQANAFMMIHQLSGIAWGNFAQMQDDMRMYRMAMSSLINFYVNYSKFNKEQIHELLKRNTWLDSKLALKWGLVDGILE